MSDDPIHTDPDKYTVVYENERVRVLEYRDHPGERTTLHTHPDSVMYTLSTFRRRLTNGEGASRDVELKAGTPGWLPAQEHAGENIGTSDTHVLFIELKDSTGSSVSRGSDSLGPSI